MTRIFFIALPLVLLAGCNSEPSGKTSTKLDAVEVQPGTVSDSMIILDNAAGDGTAIDNSVPDDGSKKDAAKPAAESTIESTDSAATNPDAVEAPATQKTAPATDSAAKKAE